MALNSVSDTTPPTDRVANDTSQSPRRVTVLGSTGSVGCNTIDLLQRHPEKYQIEALTAQSNVERLAEQARSLKPRLAVIGDAALYGALKQALEGTGIEAAAGKAAMVEAAHRPVDWVMAAIVGAAGLAATLAAVRQGAIVALANKESLVCAGSLMMAEVRAHGATLLPVDSEHNAIYQVFDFERRESIDHIIITASGGPFRETDLDTMATVTPEQAIAHPNWKMGAKISVDSATLMNKGLEMIEAHHLFDLPSERIEVVIHPQSVIHSLVAYVDGSVLAQLGAPDMRTPIAYTLGWPDRIESPAARLDLAEIAKLTFEPPDQDRFPALELCREALKAGGGAPTILSAANEIAVQEFLAGRIGFLDIVRIVERTLERVPRSEITSLEDVYGLDAAARETASALIQG
ncbi:MAG: 1-deoxy-D-xylulose-5-phosphate reductoisomerase [Proteobacteria bacterium]|nr:1-deoxy-D-xylulose-5-phosphate reductoisomerase [Pseudomonadota bacterium]